MLQRLITFKKHLHFDSHMGRMGNQMFQYACSKELQHYFKFSTSLSHLDKLNYFKLTPFERISNKIKSFLFFRIWSKIWGIEIINTNFECLYRFYLNDIKFINKPTNIWGFFQSPDYFLNTNKLIRKHFKIKDQYKVAFNFFLNQNKIKIGSYIAIHIRRTDYKGFTVPGLNGDDFTLPNSYYYNVLEKIGNPNSLPIVFVSDDPESIEKLFPRIENKIISVNDSITDFQILSNASIVITSNSTYAWWAAWLNPYANQIYCPKYFLGFKENKEVPFNIYPSHWIQIEVY